ncbi:MAG: DUF1552 domain-containing protein [Planctomycetota bacterium]|nr:MAG: DUF1552 domain-containing protein [Planctomycetota bacterium]
MHRINRRTLLRASGVSLAIPLLESMSPVLGKKHQSPPQRAVFVCTTLGLHPPNLWPRTPGTDYESTPYLELLKDHRGDFTLHSGLQHEDQTGRQPHDSEMTWLTSARKPGTSGFRNSISVDQVAASALGNVTRYPSITLGTMKPQSQSYTAGGVMIPAQTSPANLFAQLFLEGKPHEVQAQRRKLNDGQSILDQLGSESKKLRRKASSADNHLLDDYFNAVREAEKNIAVAQGWIDRPKPRVDANQPQDIFDNADLIGRARLLVDLVPLILQTDSTRIVSVMIQDHFVVPKVEGVTGNHHNLSHHGQDRSKIEQLQKIETEIIECFGSLLAQMKSKAEADATLLDNTTIVFGSNLGNANAHHARNLPIFLAGGGFHHGRYVAHKEGTPLCNLFVTVLRQLELDVESFGQSTGPLSQEETST